ncbi:hypothetical protein LJB91_00550 [Bacteroidales bacterium OttesenSCG-928-L03]|nr:hypothetical protein [Bacteroidales bacterium OttesenSCG-928-L03]
MKRINFLVLMVCCLFLGTNYVKAQDTAPIYFVNEDFESSTEVPWTFGGNNVESYTRSIVAQGSSYGNVLSLSLSGQSGSRTINTPFSNVSVPADGILYLEFDWNLGTPTNAGTNGIFFRFKDPSGNTSIAFSTASNGGQAGNALHLVNLDNTVTTDATAATTLLTPTGGNFVRGSWVSISAKLNFNTNKIELLTITNGTAIYTGTAIDFYSDDVSGLSLLEIFANRSTSNMSWTGLIDNFKVYKNAPVAQLAKLTVKYRTSGGDLKKTVDAGYFEIGKSYTLDKTPFVVDGTTYAYVSDDSGTQDGIITFTAAGEQTITVIVKEPRPAVGDLSWAGTAESNTWNMLAENFLDEENTPFEYQTNKNVTFGAEGNKTVSLPSNLDMGTGNVAVSADGYSFEGGGALNGTGKMTVNGSTSLGIPFRLSGGIDLQEGTLEVKDVATTPFTVASGTTLNVNTGAGFANSISGAGTFTLIPTSNVTYSSAISGVGTLSYQLLTQGSVNTQGTFSALPVLNNSYSGSISVTTELDEAMFGTTLSSFQALNLGAGVSMVYPTNPNKEGTTAVTIAKFSGEEGSKLKGTRIGRVVTYTVGDDTDAAFAGTFENFGPDAWNGISTLNITKVGTGTLSLSGNSDAYVQGTVQVNAGTLNLAGAVLGSDAGTVPVAVASGAILAMSNEASVAGSVTVNGSLQVGGKTIVGTAADAASPQATQASVGTLVIPANQTINFLVDEMLAADSVVVSGATTLNFASGVDMNALVGKTLAEILYMYFGTESVDKVDASLVTTATVNATDGRSYYFDETDMILKFILGEINPTASAITCEGFTAGWDEVAGADKYIVQVYLGTAPIGDPIQSATNSCPISGLAQNTDYTFSVTVVFGGVQLTPTASSSTISTTTCFSGDVLTWTGAVDAAWNNPANWDENAVPTSSVDVKISGNAPKFPILESEVAVNSLILEPGAQLGNQYLLDCDTAYVKLAFNADNLTVGDWHMLSMPISEVYSGDFSFGGHPYTFLRKFKIQDGENNTSTADWTTEYQSNNEELLIGEGFMFMVNKKGNTFGSKHSGSGTDLLISNTPRQYGIERLNGEMMFPYFDNELQSSARRVHKYDAEKKESTIYSYNYKGLVTNPAPVTLARTANSYKLAGEVVTREVAFADEANNEKFFALVGNPFVTAIDMDALYADNNEEGKVNFKKSYTVWTGKGFSTYTSNGPIGLVDENGSNLSQYIAPFQSFLIEKGDDYSAPFALEFNNATIGATNAEGVQLRSASTESNKLTITAKNSEAAYAIYVAQRDNGSAVFGEADSRMVLSAACATPQVYTLKETANGSQIGVGANIIRSNEALIPVALLTTSKGRMQLTFDGMADYAANIYFIDAVANEEIDMTGLTSYEYSFDYAGSETATGNRFFIRLAPQGTTGFDAPDSDLAYAFAEGGQIKVIAAELNAVYVYNQLGQLVTEAINLDGVSTYASGQLALGEAYLVRTVTEAGVKTHKVIVK